MGDLIQIRNSFLSAQLSLDVKSDGKYHITRMIGSSIGLCSHLKANVEIFNTVVPPQSFVSSSLRKDVLDQRAPKKQTMIKAVKQEGLSALYYLFFILIFIAHLIPVYEIWMRVFLVDSIWMAVVVLSTAILVQSITYLLIVLVLFQYITLWSSEQSGKVWSKELYAVYINVDYFGQIFCLLPTLLAGTPLYNILLQILGVTFEGRALIFEGEIYEHRFITILDKTLIDDSPGITGHFAIYDDITIGPCKVGGVIHPGTWVANANLSPSRKESGPWRTFVGTYDKMGKEISLDEELGKFNFPIKLMSN